MQDNHSVTATISLKGLVEDLEISPKTIRRMIRSGRTPKPMRINGVAYRWLQSEILEWLELGMPTNYELSLLREQREARS